MRKFLSTLALGLAVSFGAHAQDWPTKPVTIVVPFPPGGSTDTLARALAPKLQERFGQSFVVDNKPGATGTIGAGIVKRAAPDGYTLFVTSLGPLVIAPHLIKNLPYDASTDFDLLTVAVQAPNVLVVPASSPFKNVADVIAFEKANPGKLTLASSGNGSSDHLTAELFWQETKTKGVHVPYKGGAPAMSDLIAGQVDATFMNINTGLPSIKSGKLRALAITSAKRSPLLPDVPTMAELGYRMDTRSWFGLFAPRGTPAAIVDRLAAEVQKALAEPAARQQMENFSQYPDFQGPARFARTVADDSTFFKDLIAKANIKIE
ncbi:MAG: Bug family tripartite tricarboxylate transporter substrate binding protein [Gammaproteobacteria bacterium]